MNRTRLDIITVGNVGENNSTPPFYFFDTAKNKWGNVNSINSLPASYIRVRAFWNFMRVLSFRGKGGFQYSKVGCRLIEKTIAPQLQEKALLTFSQHIPLGNEILSNRKLFVYVDATLAGFEKGIGLDFEAPQDLQKYAVARERQVYQKAELIFTRSNWAKQSMIDDHGIDEKKIHVIYPGANLGEIQTYSKPNLAKLTLGFVAKDWKRKGFTYLLSLAEEIQKQGVPIAIKVIGQLPKEYASHELVNYLGFISKQTDTQYFINELQSCHFGVLFSDKESLGISNLEFLRCGVPIIGFDHQGISDALNPLASISVAYKEDVEKVANRIINSYRSDYEALREGAKKISPFLTWDRATNEIMALIGGETIEPFSIQQFGQKTEING